MHAFIRCTVSSVFVFAIKVDATKSLTTTVEYGVPKGCIRAATRISPTAEAIWSASFGSSQPASIVTNASALENEPIEPQPAPAEITTVKRYYSVLQASNEYKRRCTWLVTEESTGPVAVIKYLKTHVKGGAHGNSKKAETKDQYIRTPASTMDTISELTKEMPVKAAYNKLLHKLDVNDAPRDINVVEKKKYRMTQRTRCMSQHSRWVAVSATTDDN